MAVIAHLTIKMPRARISTARVICFAALPLPQRLQMMVARACITWICAGLKCEVR